MLAFRQTISRDAGMTRKCATKRNGLRDSRAYAHLCGLDGSALTRQSISTSPYPTRRAPCWIRALWLLQVRRQLTRTRDGLSFTAPKRGKARVVRLTDLAIAALKAHREAQNEERARAGSLWEETSLVFTSTIGTPVDVGNLTYRSFRPLLKSADLPRIRFHDLRHTCATLLLSKGTHPKIVQEMLGHANISMTMDTYSHVLPDMQEKAVSAMDDALS